MEYSRFLECLDSDFDRLRAVAPADLDAAVPTCPGWTVADLTHHVGEVYLHKTAAMRDGVEPEQWPPKELADEEPMALLERAYTGLCQEFARRKPADPAGTWYAPDQSVGFWIRRMAQETVIHRIDAELGVGQPVAPVPADLAIDGIDELLKVFVAYSVERWGSYFTDILGASPGRSYTLRTDGRAWQVRTGPATFTVLDADTADEVTISGPPTDLLRWVWNREPIGTPSGVTIAGDPQAVHELKRCIVTATQ
jgi:uncharacterized protein (TIGR03083 family)